VAVDVFSQVEAVTFLADAAHRRSPGALIEVPHLVDS
jgi:hypothetical protein